VRQGKAGQARETDEGDVVEEEGVKRRVRSKAEPSKLERSRMSLYLEEFKTIEEREKDLESIRQQEQLVREAAEQVRHEKELREQEALRKREADVLDVTKAIASVGASTLQSSPGGSEFLDFCCCFFLY
jgi:vacuolar-type H+-ATPase subunit I/STV1